MVCTQMVENIYHFTVMCIEGEEGGKKEEEGERGRVGRREGKGENGHYSIYVNSMVVLVKNFIPYIGRS